MLRKLSSTLLNMSAAALFTIISVATISHAQTADQTTDPNPDSAAYSFINPAGQTLTQTTVTVQGSDTTQNQQTTTGELGATALTPMTGEFSLYLESESIVPTEFLEPNWSPRRLVVNTVNSQNTIPVTGTTRGFQPKNLDGEVDCGAVISALKKEDLLAFDLRKILSDQSDQISAYTYTINIPANVTLPLQTEMLVVPVTLNKPNFRLTLPKQDSTTLFSLQGHFNLSTIVTNALTGSNQFYNMLNALKLTGGSLKNFPADSLQKPIDLPVNEIKFTNTQTVSLPTWQADETILTLALNKVNEFYLPSDLKFLITPRPNLTLNFVPNAETHAAYILKKQSELDPARPNLDRLSLELAPTTKTANFAFIPLLDQPSIDQNGDLNINIPNQPAILKSVRQLVQITAGWTTNENGNNVQHWKKALEIWSPVWRNKIHFPKPLAELCTQCRIDVSLMGTTDDNVGSDELQWIEKATHMSHVSFTP